MNEQQMSPLERASLIDEVYRSRGWQLAFAPRIEAAIRTALAGLRNPDLARKAKLPDDYLRGRLDMAEELMQGPRAEAEVDRNAAVEEEMREQRDKSYDEVAATGYGIGVPVRD